MRRTKGDSHCVGGPAQLVLMDGVLYTQSCIHRQQLFFSSFDLTVVQSEAGSDNDIILFGDDAVGVAFGGLRG
jgi:hypothetical protein